MSSEHVSPTEEQFAALLDLKREGPVHMLNLVRFRDRAKYDDGRSASGAEAYQSYAREAAASFQRVGARQYWIGKFELTFIGPASERWDAAFIAEYPSGEAFLAMLRDPSYREAVKHREAAVLDSRLIRFSPVKT